MLGATCELLLKSATRRFHDRFGGDAVVSVIEAERVADSPIRRGSDHLGCRAIRGARRRSRAGVISCRVRPVAVARATSPDGRPCSQYVSPAVAGVMPLRPLATAARATAKPPPTRRALMLTNGDHAADQFALGDDPQPTAVYLADTTVGVPDLTRSRNLTGDQSALETCRLKEEVPLAAARRGRGLAARLPINVLAVAQLFGGAGRGGLNRARIRWDRPAGARVSRSSREIATALMRATRLGVPSGAGRSW